MKTISSLKEARIRGPHVARLVTQTVRGGQVYERQRPVVAKGGRGVQLQNPINILKGTELHILNG